MIDILQSFVDLGKESQWKENLKDDIEATQWALNRIKFLEGLVKASELTHEYDLQMIDDVKGEAVKLYKRIDELEKEKTCLHCGVGEASYCEKCYQELIAENLKLQKKD